MIDKIIEQQETIKGMQENEESAIKIMKMYEDYKLRVDKAIELCEEQFIDYEVNYLGKKNKRYAVIDAGKIIEILKGNGKQ